MKERFCDVLMFTFWKVIISCICFWKYYLLTNADNPTAIVAPYNGSDPGYILAESNGGLANRLRVLAAYMYVGEFNFDGAHLAFIWDINDACPGHFLHLFHPIETVIFATNTSRYVLDKHAKIVYENSLAVFSWTLQMNHIPRNRFGLPTWRQIERQMYSRFVPREEIMNIVAKFVKEHNICEINAMHIRITDLAKQMAKIKKHVNIDSYFRYVENLSEDKNVFLLTDNPDTQEMFINKFGNKKVLIYRRISPSHLQQPIQIRIASISSSTTNFNNSSLKDLPEDHRFTNLEHTLIDVLIAAHAKEFRPAVYSSLSDLVKMFSIIGRETWGWCGI